MSITYRKLKGAPLSADELDQNFRELHHRLEKLEGNKSLQSHGGIARITQEGPDIIFENSLKETLGRLTIPLLNFRPRGLWKSGRNYTFYDLCIVKGATYLCNKAHKSGKSLEKDNAHWSLLFSTKI